METKDTWKVRHPLPTRLQLPQRNRQLMEQARRLRPQLAWAVIQITLQRFLRLLHQLQPW